MERICYHANALMTVNDSPNLHNNGDMRRSLLSLLYTETVCRDAFYGRCLGFQVSITKYDNYKYLFIIKVSQNIYFLILI